MQLYPDPSWKESVFFKMNLNHRGALFEAIFPQQRNVFRAFFFLNTHLQSSSGAVSLQYWQPGESAASPAGFFSFLLFALVIDCRRKKGGSLETDLALR